MSYNMTQHDTEFFMDKSNLEAARQALRNAAADCKWFNMKNARSLENAVYQFGWNLEFDDDDNVNGIEHLWECAGDERRLFHAIAPYVKPGSYIQMPVRMEHSGVGYLTACAARRKSLPLYGR